MSQVFVIAEAGVNHNGSVQIAKKLIEIAVNAVVDAVKFQTFRSEKLVVRSASKAEYQKLGTSPADSQFEMLRKLELSESAHLELKEICIRKKVEFLSTPFDVESLKFLEGLGLARHKIPSGEITNAPLLLRFAETRRPLILSTGMSNLSEIEEALSVLAFGWLFPGGKPSKEAFRKAFNSADSHKLLQEKVTLLHCTTEYPAPFDEVNLRAMGTLRAAFDLPVGLSDHTRGIAVALAAVALGAKVIEKHFTFDQNADGPDHKASLSPDELRELVCGIRNVEKAMGSSLKKTTFSEEKNLHVARKSLVATRNIKRGEVFSEENVSAKRPGSGISPMRFWEFMGNASPRDYLEDELLEG